MRPESDMQDSKSEVCRLGTEAAKAQGRTERTPVCCGPVTIRNPIRACGVGGPDELRWFPAKIQHDTSRGRTARVRGFGELEAVVMDLLWSWNRPATVREVMEHLRHHRP